MTGQPKVYSHRGRFNTLVGVRERGVARPLDLRLDLFNHSPTGFEWGFGGSGPAPSPITLTTMRRPCLPGLDLRMAELLDFTGHLHRSARTFLIDGKCRARACPRALTRQRESAGFAGFRWCYGPGVAGQRTGRRHGGAASIAGSPPAAAGQMRTLTNQESSDG